MRRAVFTTILGLVLASGPSLVARAACPESRPFDSGASAVLTPGIDPDGLSGTTVTQDFRGTFWSPGLGDPRLGFGIDSGDFPAFTGVDSGSPSWTTAQAGTALRIAGDWAASPLIDGCVDSAPAPRCMAMVLGDQAGGVGFYAALSTAADGSGTIFSFERPAGPIALAAVPPPAIRGLERSDSGDLTALVTPPESLEGAALDPLCEDRPPVVVGYRVYSFRVVAGAAPPLRRDRAAGWVAETGLLGFSDGAAIPIVCGDAVDVYLATELVFDSGFPAPYLSRNSELIQCRVCTAGEDADGDGYCGPASGAPPLDCDDDDPAVFPGAIQFCDGVNNDCSDPDWPLPPPEDRDDDGDGFRECSEGVLELVSTLADCDDGSADVGPLIDEICNGIDDDCDGAVDEGRIEIDTDRDGVPDACDNCPLVANATQADGDGDSLGDACDACLDIDGDGYGSPGHATCPRGAATDCDDGDTFVEPGAPEFDDGRDNDCDGLIDEGVDTDGDGIPDFRDRCASTPAGHPVTPDGCLQRGRRFVTPVPAQGTGS